ncbi:hypothetical protein QNH48_01535 [Neobacillus sp. YX16]|uniref:hypothetical protein n=1 Tax=Neobacillus sp. YX16 TaxID=3047874 RepID=UPI0024C24AFF|nr:hypothetical protein [Neobacillus sp. YX16]WHZ03408.1 hypothetical protein QNH48_01535 [Neobacillus sp. YX16]
MNVLIQIFYTTNDNSVLRRGNYPLKNRKPDEVAYDFWKWIKKEHPYPCELEKVIVNGEDLTLLVKNLEKAAHE